MLFRPTRMLFQRARRRFSNVGSNKIGTQRSLVAVVAAFLLTFSSITNSNADIVTWAIDADGDWAIVDNWSSNPLLPGVLDDVVIDRALPYTIGISPGTYEVNSLTSNSNIVFQGGSLKLNSSSTISGGLTWNASGSSLDGAGDLNLTNSFTWSAGTMMGTGKTILGPSSTATIGQFGTPTLARRLENSGTVTLQRLIFTNGTFNNLAGGVANLTDANFSSSSGTNSVINSGTINLTSTQPSNLPPRPFYVSLTNSATGTINVNVGNHCISGGGSSSGVINLASGTNLSIGSAFNLLPGSIVTGAGSLTLGSFSSVPTVEGKLLNTGNVGIAGSVAIYANQEIPTLIMSSSADLSGSADVKVLNTLTWGSGKMSGSGTTTIASTATATLYQANISRVVNNYGTLSTGQQGGGPVTNQLWGGTLNNYGTANITNMGTLGTTGNTMNNYGVMNLAGSIMPKLNNKSGGTIYSVGSGANFGALVVNDGTMNFISGTTFTPSGATGSLTNNGIVNVPGGATSSAPFDFSDRLTNSATGVVNITSGYVAAKWTQFGGTSTNSGTINIAAGATLQSAFTLNPTSVIQGAGNVDFIGATTFKGSLQNTGNVNFSGATSFPADHTFSTPVTVSGLNSALYGSGILTFTKSLSLIGPTGTVNSGILGGFGKSILTETCVTTSSYGTLSQTVENYGLFTIDGGLAFASGVLKNYATVNLNGSIAANAPTGNTFENYGTTNLNPIAGFPNSLMFSNAALNNKSSGVVTVNTNFGFGVVSSNAGVIHVNEGKTIQVATNAQLNNTGVINFKGGLSDFSPMILRKGIVNQTGGVINLLTGYMSTLDNTDSNSGTINLAAGTTLILNSNYLQPAGSAITGDGSVKITNAYTDYRGALSAKGTISLENSVAFNSAQNILGSMTMPWNSSVVPVIAGTGTVTIDNNLKWAKGTMSGTGKTIISPTGILEIRDSSQKTLSRLLENNGTVSVSLVDLYFAGGTFNNKGVYNTGYDSSFFNTSGTNAFNNSGTMNTIGPNGAYDFSIPFNNSGTLNITGDGTVVRAGGTNTGAIKVVRAAADSEAEFLSTSAFTNSGTMTFDAPTNTWNNTIWMNGVTNTATGSIKVQSGGWILRGTTTNSGNVDIAAGASLSIQESYAQAAGATFTGAGSLYIASQIPNFSGTIGMTGSTSIRSSVTFNVNQNISGPLNLSGLLFNGIELVELKGSGSLTINGPFNWSGGAISGSNKTTLSATSTSTFSDSPTVKGNIDNYGVINLAASLSMYSPNGKIITNYGVINTHTNPFNSRMTFVNNLGTINAVNETGTVDFDVENNGTFLKSGAGLLRLSGLNNGVLNATGGQIALSYWQPLQNTTIASGTWNLTDTQMTVTAPLTLTTIGANAIIRLAGPTSGISNFPFNKNLGTFEISAGKNYDIAGTLTNDGLIKVGSSSTLTLDYVTHAQGKGQFNVGAGGTLVSNGLQADTVTIAGAAVVRENGTSANASKVETLTMQNGGLLNLKDNDLVIGTGDVEAIRAQIILGKNNAATSGITSDLPNFGTKTGFAYALGNDSKLSSLLAGQLSGQAFDSNSVLVKYTLLGDADLDGDTDLNDLGLWSSAYTGDLGVTTSATTFWTSGDFDYDGDTDLNDLGLWSSTYTGDLNGGAGSLIVFAPGAPESAVEVLNAMGITVVPEPAVIYGAICVVALAMHTRRRSRQSTHAIAS